jgi:hypothetical protein
MRSVDSAGYAAARRGLISADDTLCTVARNGAAAAETIGMPPQIKASATIAAPIDFVMTTSRTRTQKRKQARDAGLLVLGE